MCTNRGTNPVRNIGWNLHESCAPRIRRRARSVRRGFTLIEALMAAGMLLGIIVAVTSAITAGQQNAHEAQQRIAGALAAEELMGRIATEPYARIATWNGHVEDVGELTDAGDEPLPSTLQGVGREVQVASGMKNISGLDVRVRGLTVTVRSFNSGGRSLAQITRFVPEPQS
jgi:type II secretory pathway pseudopilin PulG